MRDICSSSRISSHFCSGCSSAVGFSSSSFSSCYSCLSSTYQFLNWSPCVRDGSPFQDGRRAWYLVHQRWSGEEKQRDTNCETYRAGHGWSIKGSQNPRRHAAETVVEMILNFKMATDKKIPVPQFWYLRTRTVLIDFITTPMGQISDFRGGEKKGKPPFIKRTLPVETPDDATDLIPMLFVGSNHHAGYTELTRPISAHLSLWVVV